MDLDLVSLLSRRRLVYGIDQPRRFPQDTSGIRRFHLIMRVAPLQTSPPFPQRTTVSEGLRCWTGRTKRLITNPKARWETRHIVVRTTVDRSREYRNSGQPSTYTLRQLATSIRTRS